MANNRTLTAANSTLLLAAGVVFPVPIKIQGYSTDDMTGMDAISPKEVSMGIDGRLSAGYVPVPVTQNISLQADSESNDFFEAVHAYEQQTRETMFFSGTLIVPGVGRVYAMTRGVLTNYAPIADLRRTLQPRRFSLVWEKVAAAPSL
jgi:hypothetical protein